ncbi:PorV/PorQ family protein [candidate division KSB1 bacterium]|nr:MAG: PorV/PorQ family protein [candidate division KSB1 bacterium]
MKYIFVALILLASTVSVFAATGLAFLEIPVGARESALGGAGVALITGPTSAMHNPAAVAFTPRSIALMHTKHFGDTKAQFVGFTVRRGRFALSPHYWGTRVSDIEYRTAPTSTPISTFDALNWVVGSALAMELGKHVAVGVSAKYLYQKIHVEDASGYTADIGVLTRDFLKGLSVGLAVQHFGHVNEFVSESPNLPTTLRGGAAYEHAISKYGTLLVTAEAQAVKDNTPRFVGGLEYRAPDYLALRAGYVSGLEAQNFSAGVGFFIKQYRLDYCFIPYRENLGEGHRFSLTFDI